MNTILNSLVMLFMLTNAVVMAAEDSSPKKNMVSGGIVINDSLKRLIDVDGVAPIYEGCQKDYTEETTERTQKVIDCLWKGVKNNAQLKKKVQEVYAKELKGERTPTEEGRAPASSSQLNLTARKAIVATDYESDPAVEALSEFYGKKLDAVLNPEVALTAEERKKNVILSVDHRQFIDLYKSQLGKTIIGAFTSYCLDTDPATCACTKEELKACAEDKTQCICANNTCSIDDKEEERKKHREANLKSLKIADLKSGSTDATKWTMCIKAVTNSCKTDSPDNNSETNKRSCLVMDYVKAARKNIMVADTQKAFYDDLNSTQTANIASNMKAITDLKKTSSDAVLEMTSADVKTAMEKPITNKLKDLEGCYKDGVIVNAKACEKYLSTNKDDNDTALAELGMRQIAQEGILEEQLNSSDQKVRDYLKEEGYTKDQIETMTADKDNIEMVKKQILERYANQKSAIIKEMADRIADKTTTNDGKIDGTAGSGDVSKLGAIKAELETRSEDLQNLVYFNNIVSSYLEISDGKGNNSRNTASLYAEANSLDEEQGVLMKKQIKDAELKDQKGAANTTNLDVNTINDNFLNYETKKNEK